MARTRDAGCWSVFGGLLLVAGALGSGCASVSPSQYVAPRVTGRVLDSETRQPLSGVQVRRTDATSRSRSDTSAHGGAVLDDATSARSDGEGRFLIPSARVFGPFGSAGWYSVTISFERSGYGRLVNTYTLGQSTNMPSGEPWVDAGEVLLPKAER